MKKNLIDCTSLSIFITNIYRNVYRQEINDTDFSPAPWTCLDMFYTVLPYACYCETLTKVMETVDKSKI